MTIRFLTKSSLTISRKRHKSRIYRSLGGPFSMTCCFEVGVRPTPSYGCRRLNIEESMPKLRSNRTEIADWHKNAESPIQTLTYRAINLCSQLVLMLFLISLVGCHMARPFGARNSGGSDERSISLWGNQRQSQTVDDSLQLANDARTSSDESPGRRRASVLEESTAEAASNSSWTRIFDRFRPAQHSSELPRTDVENSDAALDESASFDSGF